MLEKMDEKHFTDLIGKYIEQFKNTNALNTLFGCFIEAPIIAFGWKMFDEVIRAYFTEDGIDWIYYFLEENPENCYYTEEGKRIPLENEADLWKLVKDYLK